jgi:hypothetical protein
MSENREHRATKTSGSIKRVPTVGFLECSLFFFVWCVYGIAVNTANLNAFNLQQAGVEAMVERHQFSVEGSATPQLQIKVYYDGERPFGDTFLYNGRQYAAKQPGQFMLGAAVYFVLRRFGLTYVNNYALTSALVSFLTTALVAALAALAVFRIARIFTGNKTIAWPLACSLLYAFATTTFAYSGFAYHDSLASGYLGIAFYLLLLLSWKLVDTARVPLVAAGAGFLLGLTVTTSMLPFFMACVMAVYLLWISRSRGIVAALIGGALGVAPLLIYNAKSFGNPLLNSYIAGGYPESFLHFDLHNSIAKVWLYISEITLYDPIVWLGVIALAFYPRAVHRERLLIAALFIAHAFQVLNIDSHGGCHYGPRFLLPVLPYAAIGLAGFYFLRSRTALRLAVAAVALAGAASIAINGVGAIFGAMYCEVQVYALWPALAMLRNGNLTTLPLAKWLIVPALISLFLLIYATQVSRRGLRSANG